MKNTTGELTTNKRRFFRTDLWSLIFSILQIVVALIAIVVSIYVQNIRNFLELDSKPQTPIEGKDPINYPVNSEKLTPAPIEQSESNSDENSDSEGETSPNNSNNFALVETRNESGLFVRERKNISSNWIAFAPENERLEVLYCENENVVINARLGNWCRIKYEELEGWGFGPYIGIYTDGDDRITENDSNIQHKYVVKFNDCGGIYLTENKNLEGDSLIFVKEGEEVEMIYCDEQLLVLQNQDGRSCKIKYNGVQGWVWGWFIDKKTRYS